MFKIKEMEGSGYIILFNRGGEMCHGISYHQDQLPEFSKIRKVLVTLVDSDTLSPVLENGEPVKALKSRDALQIIGYAD